MALEEAADLQKYLVKRIKELENMSNRLNQDLYEAEEEIKWLKNQLAQLKGTIANLKNKCRFSKYMQLEKENLKLSQENNELRTGKKEMINILCKEAYLIAKSKGWHDEPKEMGTILALIHSEISEALEADRRNEGKERVTEELADTCIRIFDLCGELDLDLETAISKKMEYNKTRPYKHGGKAY